MFIVKTAVTLYHNGRWPSRVNPSAKISTILSTNDDIQVLNLYAQQFSVVIAKVEGKIYFVLFGSFTVSQLRDYRSLNRAAPTTNVCVISEVNCTTDNDGSEFC